MSIDDATEAVFWLVIFPFVLAERLTEDRLVRLLGIALCLPWAVIGWPLGLVWAMFVMVPMILWDLTK